MQPPLLLPRMSLGSPAVAAMLTSHADLGDGRSPHTLDCPEPFGDGGAVAATALPLSAQLFQEAPGREPNGEAKEPTKCVKLALHSALRAWPMPPAP